MFHGSSGSTTPDETDDIGFDAELVLEYEAAAEAGFESGRTFSPVPSLV